MNIVSLRESPGCLAEAIAYFQSKWASPDSMKLYEDCLTACVDSASPLPQWYLLYDGADIAGCAGLITNDFISRMDLWPWACALFVEEAHRGHGYGSLLLDRAKSDAKAAGFESLYLCTDHVGFYERYGFEHIGTGYHPWGESSRIYKAAL